jgi:hypothetical protein
LAAFDDWLRWLRSAQKGPATLTASRGRDYPGFLRLSGDFTGATLRGQIRIEPDAAGAPLTTFTVSGPVVEDGVTTFTISLTGVEIDALPAAPIGDGAAQFAYDLLMTVGGDEDLLLGGVFAVIGRVTE